MSKQSVLLITLSVGYGHKAAAINVEQALRKENPELNILTLDVHQYLASIAARTSNQWDIQLRKGNSFGSLFVGELVRVQGLYESAHELFFNQALEQKIHELFAQHQIIAIYDTQPLLTPVLYKLISGVCADNLIYHKILTDLPTPKNTSYFGGLKRTKLHANLPLKVHSPPPLLAPYPRVAEFWQQHCGLSVSHIDDKFAFPIHSAYLQAPDNPHDLKIDIHSSWQITLPLPANAFVTTLMLGSQGLLAIYDYTGRYLEQLAAHHPEQPHYFFIICSKNETLYHTLEDFLHAHPLHRDSPHRIIPLTMQTMEAVASLMWRSNQVIIRSGGISSLEQLALGQMRGNDRAQLFIHSLYKGDNPEDMLKHVFAWERGNAEYLMAHLGAKMTAPQLVSFF